MRQTIICILYVQRTATHCNTLQYTATHCNTLQHTATHQMLKSAGQDRHFLSILCLQKEKNWIQKLECEKRLQVTGLALQMIDFNVAVCCGVLHCVVVCCGVCCSVCCGVLRCVAVCCSVLQCVAMCCGVLQCGAV